MSTFPSTLSTISDPAATDKLNAPSHSSIESSQNDAIAKLETFVGTLSSAAGTLMYDIRAAASDGGGHVQAANKGGTGQTAFTKGDVLVAQSASVISKLAIGSDNQVLTADSTQNTGVKWAGVANAVDIQNQTYTYVRASVMSGSVFGVVLAQDPSILSDGLGLVVKFPAVPTSSAMALQVHTSSSGSVAARIKRQDLTDPETTDIAASAIGILEFESVSSVFQMVSPAPGITSSQQIADVSLGADTSSIVSGTFSAYDLLQVHFYSTGFSAGTPQYKVRFNGDSDASYDFEAVSNGTAVGGSSSVDGIIVNGTTAADAEAYYDFKIHNIDSLNSFLSFHAIDGNGRTAIHGGGRWNNTGQITSVSIHATANNINSGSRIVVYGRNLL